MTDRKIKEKIKAYNANSVQHLDGLEHIRTRPTMYLGSVSGNPNHLFEEALENSLDEYSEGVAHNLVVRLFDDDSIAVIDDGRGIPPEYADKFKMPIVRALLTMVDTGKSFNNNNPSASQHGIGMKAAVATSDWLEVTVWRNGYEYFDRYETVGKKLGVPAVKLKKDKNGKPQLPRKRFKPGKYKFEHGTMVRFKPSDEVWGNPTFNWASVLELTKKEAYIHPGMKFTLVNDQTGDVTEYDMQGGTIQLLKDIVADEHRTLITPIFKFRGQYDTDARDQTGKPLQISAEVTLAWTNDSNNHTLLFTNNVPNPNGGTPVNGLNNGIARLMNKYAKDLNLSKNTIEQRDITPGMLAVINMMDPHPDFNGQTKDEITSKEPRLALNVIAYNQGQLEFDKAIDPIKEVIKLALKRANERKKESEGNVSLNTKAVTNRVNKKLAGAKKLGSNAELFIVEGDSAAGTLINERDNKFQAIMPVRGKVLNTYKATLAHSMDNVELNTIFAALGTGVGKNFNLKKLKYGKIIIATDADPDGGHIADLLLTALVKFMPQLIMEGHVYRSLSPLYINKLKGGKEQYVYTEDEQTQFIAKHKSKIVNTNRNKGLGELSADQVQQIIINPATRRLAQYQLSDDMLGDTFEMMDALVGKDTERRKEIFTDPARYQTTK